MREANIMVAGLGGAGVRIVERLREGWSAEAALAAIDTEAAALAASQAAVKLQIGASRANGFGAGGDAGLGRLAAEDDREALAELFRGRDLVLLAVGLGGGTGTGAAPVALNAARDAGATTLCFATLPFDFEGPQRKLQAEGALAGLREVCDALIAVPNERLLEAVGEGTLAETFARADRILGAGMGGVCKLITQPGYINLSFADLQRVIRRSGGVCTLGYGDGAGQNRAAAALKALLDSPLLERGAKIASAASLLVSVVGGSDLTVREIRQIMAAIEERKSHDCQVAMGTVVDDTWRDRITITVIAADERLAPEAAEEQAAAAAAPEPDEGLDEPPEPERRRKKRGTAEQADLDLGTPGKGRFRGTEPTMMDGENLDIPTYVRRGIAIEK